MMDIEAWQNCISLYNLFSKINTKKNREDVNTVKGKIYYIADFPPGRKAIVTM
jgi:hypothetical protein